jgi:hypothetical protein
VFVCVCVRERERERRERERGGEGEREREMPSLIALPVQGVAMCTLQGGKNTSTVKDLPVLVWRGDVKWAVVLEAGLVGIPAV